MTCNCTCHTHHLAECGECLEIHYEKAGEIRYTDSAIADRISEYFHRYAIKGERLGTFYYEMIFSGMISGNVIEFDSDKMSYINYLFKHRKQSTVYKLIHRGIILFLRRNGKGDMITGCNGMGMIKWRISNNNNGT